MIKDTARVVGMTVKDYRATYGQRIETAVAVLEGKDVAPRR